VGHFLASGNELFEYALRDEMVGITIQNQVNQNDKPIGITFRRKDQLSGEVIWSVFEKVSPSNARFNALDTLVVTVHSVKMPLSVMAHLKSSIVEVNAEENCLALALIIAIARVENNANYKAYRQGRKLRPVVEALLQQTGMDLTRGGGSPNLTASKNIFAIIR